MRHPSPACHYMQLQVPFDSFRQLLRNEVTLVGNLGADINMRQTSTGKDIGTVNIAVKQSGGSAAEPATAWWARHRHSPECSLTIYRVSVWHV